MKQKHFNFKKQKLGNKMKKLFIIICMLFGFTAAIEAQAQIDFQQKLKGYVDPEELITLSETIPFSQAIDVISKVSEKLTGKRVVSTVNITTPIGVEIEKMSYKKALFIIVQYHNLTLEETENNLVVKRKDDKKETLAKDIYAPVDEREVKISALLFEGNVAAMREMGINWQFLLSRGGLKIGGNLVTVQEQQQNNQSSTGTNTGTTTGGATTLQNPPDFSVTSESKFSMGKFDGDATALFRFFESENLGKIISRPTVVVVNGQLGRTQVGSDIAIKERDFAGNLIDRFYSTGTIIEVKPYIYKEDGVDYVYLDTKVEKSSVLPSATLTEITKTAATTKILLLDGEEVAIGGLFVNDESNVRRGVPFLKDLPWWFFGLRYIFGYDETAVTTKEIIMLIKVNILPTLKERIDQKKQDQVLSKEWQNQTDDLQKYKEEIEKAKAERKQEMEKKQNEESEEK